MASINKPQILLLSLSYLDFFDEIYSSLIDQLAELSYVKRVKTADAALRELSNSNFRAVIITDQGLAESSNREVLTKIKSYIQDGGLAIIGLHFPNFVTMNQMNALFKEFDLPWEKGDYHRTTFTYVPSSTLPESANRASFPAPFSMKAVHIQNARRQEKVFVPTSGALTQSHVFSPSRVDESQAAVTSARIGWGDLVYCGDINGEAGANAIIMALCGF